MNSDYAKANYNVEVPTQKLKMFNAGNGIRDIHTSINVIYMFDQRNGAIFITDVAYLVGTAGKSPIVSQKIQPFMGLFVFYTF